LSERAGGQTDGFDGLSFHNLALPFCVKMGMIQDHSTINTIATGSVSMITLQLTTFISQPDITAVCQIVITLATIAKFVNDLRSKKNENNK